MDGNIRLAFLVSQTKFINSNDRVGMSEQVNAFTVKRTVVGVITRDTRYNGWVSFSVPPNNRHCMNARVQRDSFKVPVGDILVFSVRVCYTECESISATGDI